jgi:hypothetical protein
MWNFFGKTKISKICIFSKNWKHYFLVFYFLYEQFLDLNNFRCEQILNLNKIYIWTFFKFEQILNLNILFFLTIFELKQISYMNSF